MCKEFSAKALTTLADLRIVWLAAKPAMLECRFLAVPARPDEFPRNCAQALARAVREEFRRASAGDDASSSCHRSRSMLVLLRCSVHRGMPHAYRRAHFHQENLLGQFARFGSGNS